MYDVMYIFYWSHMCDITDWLNEQRRRGKGETNTNQIGLGSVNVPWNAFLMYFDTWISYRNIFICFPIYTIRDYKWKSNNIKWINRIRQVVNKYVFKDFLVSRIVLPLTLMCHCLFFFVLQFFIIYLKVLFTW